MKKNLVIAVVLSLVMLVTLATPVLADRDKGPMPGPQGTATFTVSTTHLNNVKVSVTANGFTNTIGQSWTVKLYSSGYGEEVIGTAIVNSRGVLKVTGTTSTTYSGTDVSFKVRLYWFTSIQYEGNATLSFK